MSIRNRIAFGAAAAALSLGIACVAGMAPDYEPARTNLALLASQNEVALGETAAAVLPGGRR
jgi:hypothetical protein